MRPWSQIFRRATMAACLRLAFILASIAHAINPDRDRPRPR